MAKKKPISSGEMTKKQVSRHRKEKEQKKWIWITTGGVVALIVAVLIIGIVAQNTQAMGIVNDERIKLSTYQKRVRFWYHYYNDYLMPGAFDNLEQAQREEFFQGIASDLIDETLIRQEADKLGLVVSDEEVQIELEENWFQHYRVPPTPTPSPTPDPEAEPAEATTPVPTSTPDTEETFQTNYTTFQETVLKASGMSEQDFRRIVEVTLLRTKLQNALVTEVPIEEEQVQLRYTSATDADDAQAKIAAYQAGVELQAHARHILVATQEEAESILTRINAGESFVDLAAEFSTDESNKDQGGDLGWFGRGRMVAPFDEAVFTGEVGLYPFPVQTDFGFHIIEILERGEQQINLDEVLYDMGWNNRTDLASQFGMLFAEMVFSSEIGLIQQPIPTEFGTVIVEVVGRELHTLSEEEQEQRKAQLFESQLEQVRTDSDIEDRWALDMVPRQM